jgi:hypothetical protein
MTFTHERDFDDNGIIYWIGTNGGTTTEWVNPAQVGLVVVSSSEGKNLPYGRLEDILNRDSSALNCHTNDDKRAWFAIDLGIHYFNFKFVSYFGTCVGRTDPKKCLVSLNSQITSSISICIKYVICGSIYSND